jgi:hypothetical protein
MSKPTGPFIQGAGAEQGQQARARVAFQLALAGRPVSTRRHGRGVNMAKGDFESPQHIAERPHIVLHIDETAAVGSTFVPHLPGRIPPAGWDGEPGAAAPTVGMV